MSSRMEKYELDTSNIPRRTERNRVLYESNEVDDYNKFDINSNISVLKNNAREIDVDQIRDILDKKYRDNMPKRKSIDIPEYEEPVIEVDEDTKEYDINSVLSKAKEERTIDYDTMRLNKTAKTDALVAKINEKYGHDNKYSSEEEELKELINTITNLELKSQKQDADLLGLSDDTTVIEDVTKTNTGIVPKKLEEEFYTGNLTVNDDDFDDFKDMQNDIKSNSIFIKILVFVVILALIALGIYVLNNVLDLGLF